MLSRHRCIVQAFDFYLVDGRFRVASICACFLHAARHGRAPDEFRVGIHDFQRKDYYADALLVGDVVEGYNPATPRKAGENALLAVLRRKPKVTDAEILEVWKRHSQRVG